MVNLKTREYCVYITDEHKSTQGSGVLFYPGGDTIFVFTCAHVVKSFQKVSVFILKEIDSSNDLYEVIHLEAPSSQIIYSPVDKAEANDSVAKDNTEDIAIIRINKPEGLELSKSNYQITEANRDCPVIIQGYPGGTLSGHVLIECLDSLRGTVLINCLTSNQFVIRLDDTFIDQGARVTELQGLSGAPVWDDNEESNGLLGLFTSAYGAAASLSKTYVTKANRIRLIMNERFNIVIGRKLENIKDDIIVSNDLNNIPLNKTSKTTELSENENWLKDQLTELHIIIEDLKLQKAIDRSKELIDNPRYNSLNKESKRRIKQHLLYCYEIAYMDDEFEALEEDMKKEGLIKEHDILRQLTRSFMKRQFEETIKTASQCIDTWDNKERVDLLSLAKAYLTLAKAYTENLSVEESIGKLLDDDNNFIYPTDEAEDAALVYQMIGYVYGEHYHDYTNSIRYLNRSYQVGYDSIVLESLGAAYYNMGIIDATDESGYISDWRRIDQKSLYNARECFLTIKSKADELFWSGTMRRLGLCVYNTFVFLHDNYRVLTLYKDIKEYMSDLNDEQWRDIEMKYAMVSVQKGEIDTSEFPHITKEDSTLLNAVAVATKCSNLIEEYRAKNSNDQNGKFEKELRSTIRFLEDSVRRINHKERTQLYVQMINLYGYGMLMFGWNKKEKLKRLYDRLSEYADSESLESINNFIFEMDAPIEETEKRFKASFDKHRNIITWQELNHMYIRHGMFDKSDAMYQELFSKRKELFEESPEYAYRAFIDYVILYKRDLKYALKCYLGAKEAFKDTDIEGFLELELMQCTSSFNNPERFLIDRRRFVDDGLVTEESYHRTAFIANLANLNTEETIEQYKFIQQYPHAQDPRTGTILLSKEEIYFLNWANSIEPGFNPSPDSMSKKRAEEVTVIYESENWHREIDNSIKNRFSLNKELAIDAWSLYQLAENNILNFLEELETVYVSHATVLRLLDELSKTNNNKIRIILGYLKASDKVKINSAKFKAQLEVRNIAEYTEPSSAVAVAVEKNCLMIYGEPEVDGKLIEYYGNRIIRINELDKLIY